MEYNPGQCPFLKQECITKRCTLWGKTTRVGPGKLAGTVEQVQIEACVFHIIALKSGQGSTPMRPLGPPRTISRS